MEMSQQSCSDQNSPHSLSSLPAGLEVVTSNDKQVLERSEKETVKAELEVISQEGKEAIWQSDKEALDTPPRPHGQSESSAELSKNRRVCGLERRVFWALLVAFGVILALAAGLGEGLSSRKSKAESERGHAGNTTHTQVLQQATPVCAILKASKAFIDPLKNSTSGTVISQEDAERRYAIAMVRELRLYNPNKHVIIYHDPNSIADFDANARHARTTLDLGLGFSRVYETYIFSYGNFTCAGPADYTNVCWDGIFTQRGKQVVFKDRNDWSNQAIFNDTSLAPGIAQPPPPTPPVLPPSIPARLNSSNEDGYYFLNCSSPHGSVSSGVAYYVRMDPGHNLDQLPHAYVNISDDSYVDWTVPDAVLDPHSNVPLYWAVFGGAESHAVHSLVGVADSGTGHRFWMYKDSGNVLYHADGWACRSLYWAY